mgnify:CR=1 FL=1
MGKKRRGKRVLKILAWFFGLIAVCLLVFAVLHATYFSARYNRLQPTGSLVDVFDGQMHVLTAGSGDRTIVLLPGMGVPLPSADFGPLMRRFSEEYTVAVVEYFGVGFSSGTSRERTSENYVEEIREALKKAKLSGPFILMGHSISSVYSEHYAALYPEEVTAIISLDGTSTAYYAPAPAMMAKVLPIAKGAQALGLSNVLGPLVTNRQDAYDLGYTEQEIQNMLIFGGFSINDILIEQMIQSTEFIAQTKQLPYPKQVPFFKIIARDTFETVNKQIPIPPDEYQYQHLERIGAHAQYEILDGNHFIYQTNVEPIFSLVQQFLASSEDSQLH